MIIHISLLWLIFVTLISFLIGRVSGLHTGRKMYEELNKSHKLLEDKLQNTISSYLKR